MTLLRLLALFSLAAIGCQTTQKMTALTPALPPQATVSYAGTDSTLVQKIIQLAAASFVEEEREQEAALLLQEGISLVTLVDSVLRSSDTLHPVTPDTEASVRAFSSGADALQEYAATSDSARAGTLLRKAENQFEKALRANPFDAEAHYWLSRVYTLRAQNVQDTTAHGAALESLRRLVSMHPEDHRTVALLAASYEQDVDSMGIAGALWQRAAHLAADDAALDPEGIVQADSASIFGYYVRSSRALIEANRSIAARHALKKAENWSGTAEDLSLLEEEHQWIMWDNGNLQTRKMWDALLLQAHADPLAAATQMAVLLQKVTRRLAREEVRHQLALLYYRTGGQERAADMLHTLWREKTSQSPANSSEKRQLERVREDFGTIVYNMAQARQDSGDTRGALMYLLQSEATDFSGAARAAFEAAWLLKNNIEAALEVALRAERGMAQMEIPEQKRLLRYLIELYRRKEDREQAMHYLHKYRALPDATNTNQG